MKESVFTHVRVVSIENTLLHTRFLAILPAGFSLRVVFSKHFMSMSISLAKCIAFLCLGEIDNSNHMYGGEFLSSTRMLFQYKKALLPRCVLLILTTGIFLHVAYSMTLLEVMVF